MTDLAIIIVSHNTKADLEGCIRSLRQHPPRIPHEIVVVDNASSDGSVEAVRTGWPDIRVIALDRNVGFSSANNTGIRETSSELVLLLNSDTIVPDGAIDRLVGALRELPGAAVAGPRIVDANGQPELSFGRMIGPFAELRQKLLVRLASPAKLKAKTARVREVDWVTAACLLVGRRHAEAAGLLDERYFMYLRGRGLLRGGSREWRQGVLRAGGRDRPPSRPVVARQPLSHPRPLPPQSAGVLPEAPSGLGTDPAAVPRLTRKAAAPNGR